MTKRTGLLVATLAFALLLGCGTPSSDSSDGVPAEGMGNDVAAFASLGDLAGQRVRQAEPGATLQQVDVAPGDGRYEFRFVADQAGTRVLVATGAVGASIPEAFTVTPGAALAQPPGAPIDLAGLRLGPDGVVAAVVRELSAASPRSLVLTRQDGRLVWRVVVNGPQGIVSGTVPDDTGRFVRDTT